MLLNLRHAMLEQEGGADMPRSDSSSSLTSVLASTQVSSVKKVQWREGENIRSEGLFQVALAVKYRQVSTCVCTLGNRSLARQRESN